MHCNTAAAICEMGFNLIEAADFWIGLILKQAGRFISNTWPMSTINSHTFILFYKSMSDKQANTNRNNPFYHLLRSQQPLLSCTEHSLALVYNCF